LDCLIFRDELEAWASKGYDFIGAPLFKGYTTPTSKELWRVGNGGLSLRNVHSHLRVLKSKTIRGYIYPHNGWVPADGTDFLSERGLYQRMIPWYRRYHPFSKWVTIEEELKNYDQNEDYFWSQEAPKFDPSFKIPSAEEALAFAFENEPRWCFERNNRKLPFGCHAWARYDREFWEAVLRAQEGSLVYNIS